MTFSHPPDKFCALTFLIIFWLDEHEILSLVIFFFFAFFSYLSVLVCKLFSACCILIRDPLYSRFFQVLFIFLFYSIPIALAANIKLFIRRSTQPQNHHSVDFSTRVRQLNVINLRSTGFGKGIETNIHLSRFRSLDFSLNRLQAGRKSPVHFTLASTHSL